MDAIVKVPPGRAFLATYRPLCRTKKGRAAVERFGIAPFVDGSCRREPDLEAPMPTITALCRRRAFAPRLHVGDRIAYITKLGKYGGGPPHWRLTALIRVVERFEDHTTAAKWFKSRGLPLPRNLVVDGNGPVPLEHTDGVLSPDLRARTAGKADEQVVRTWDLGYLKRSRDFGVVLACEIEFRELTKPPAIQRSDWNTWIGRVPSTRNPPRITEELWDHLKGRSANRAAGG